MYASAGISIMKKTVTIGESQNEVVKGFEGRKLPEDYQWIHDNPWYDRLVRLLYPPFAAFAWIYDYGILGIRIENPEILKPYKNQGIFIYINHTQEVGDPFFPFILLNHHYYAVCAVDNLSIPILGKLLPALGALPIPDNRQQMKKFREAIHTRIEQKQTVVIFPEAHVWTWCTFIRDFPDTSFQFPCELDAPCFTATMTYQDAGKKKPKIRCILDGPFVPDPNLPRRKKREVLYDQVRSAMEKAAEKSNQEYIHYEIEKKDTM